MDQELEELRCRVDCRAVLESAGWALDKRQSSVNAAKYRGGAAQIVIVTHQGQGWFDPLSDGRGDVFALAQYLWGGSFGNARKALRPLAGIAPALLPRLHQAGASPRPLDAPRAWDQAPRLAPGSQGWAYLREQRGLPTFTLDKALKSDALREGICGTVWALHRATAGEPCGWEMRGPRYKGFSRGGGKALFWLGELASARRVAVAESAIDALSLATLEGWPEDTAYASTGGGFGPRTAEVIRALVPLAACLVAATDQDRGGELLAGRLHEVARACCAGYTRLRPKGKDWNAQLRGE
jgi:Protein of unknown function (DUF3991)/Toprim-like